MVENTPEQEPSFDMESDSNSHSAPVVSTNPIDDVLKSFENSKDFVPVEDIKQNYSFEVISPDGQEGTLPENEVQEALNSGFTLPEPSTDEVSVKNKDGVIGTLPKEELHDAIASGEYSLLNDEDKKADKYLDELNDSEITSSIKTFGEGAASMVPILGDYVEDKINEDPAFARAFKQFEDQHPVSHYAGKAAGFAGTMYATAGLSNAVMGAKAIQTLTPLTRIAIEGAMWSAPEAVDRAIQGDYVGAAESLALGSLTNVGFHGLGKGIGAVKGKLADRAIQSAPAKAIAAAEKEAATNLAAENTFMKEVGVTPAKAKQVRKLIPKILDSAEITAKDTTESAIQKILKLQDSGKLIGNAIKKLEEAPNKVEAITQALFKTSDELTESLSKLVGVERAQAERALKPILKQIDEVSKLTDIGFEHTQGLKKFVAEQTDFAGKKLTNRVKKDAYGVLNKNLKSAEDDAANALSDASIIADLQKDRLAYSLRKVMGDFAEKAQSKEVLKTPLEKIGDILPKGTSGWLEGAVINSIMGLTGLHGIAGIAAGTVLNKGAQVFRQAAENRKFGEAIRILSKESVTPAADAVLSSNKLMRDELAIKAKSFLSDMTNKYKGPVVSKALNTWIVDGGQGRSKQSQLNEIKSMAAMHKVNPEMVNQHLAEITQPLRDEGLEQVANEYTNHQLRLMKVIDTILPQDPTMSVAHPFSAEVKKQDISPVAMAQYERALTLSVDPTHLFELVKNNTISRRDVAIVAATNPQTYQKMKMEIIKEGMKKKPDLSYQQRLSLGIFMGENIDASTQMVPQLQSIYMQQPQGQSQNPKLSSKAVDRIDESVKSGSQKSAGT